MKILINNEEHVTVSCNHLDGDPTKHHALTISNYSGFLNCLEFNRPEEKEESSATDNQQLKAAIALVRDGAHRYLTCLNEFNEFERGLETIEQRAAV